MALMTTTTQDKEFVSMLLAGMVPTPDDKFVARDSGLVSDVRDLAPAGLPEGVTFKVDQNSWLTGTYTEASRALTEATDITTTAIGISQTQYSFTMKEYGGPYDQGNTRVAPLGLTKFQQRRAKHDQATIITDQLRRDMMKVQDKIVIDLALTATNQTTADGTAAASIIAGKLASYEWLTRVYKALEIRNIPTFKNGRYRMLIGAKDEYDLKNDATFKLQAQYDDKAASMITTGYITTAAGFDLIKCTTMPTAAVGAGSAVTGYQSIAFGSLDVPNEAENIGSAPKIVGGPIGFLEARPPQVNEADDTNYGRNARFVWTADWAWGSLDLQWIEKGLTT